MSETTATLVQDREAQRRSLKERLAALDVRRGGGPVSSDADTVTAHLARLDLLRRDVPLKARCGTVWYSSPERAITNGATASSVSAPFRSVSSFPPRTNKALLKEVGVHSS